jgi:hypothetical protein
MSNLPAAYREIINPLIASARGFLESGEDLRPVAFVGNLSPGSALPVLLDSRDDEAKEASCRAIRLLAEAVDADFIFVMMEAWSLRKDKMSQMEAILARYGSIGACPYRVDIVALSLETCHGLWMAEQPIKPKGVSKKRRTFDEPRFRLFKDARGRFAELLPRKDSEAPPGVLH